MERKRIRVMAAVAGIAMASGCATAGRDTAIGAGVGGAAGAGIGALLGGGKGALIGLGVGALAGGSVGLYLDKQRKELERVAQVKQTDNGLIVQLAGDILFETGSAILRPEAVDQISRLGDVIAKYADDRVRIEGYTDSQGPAGYNEELSLRRADAVKRVLTSRGVQEKQILTLGMGETRPIADNATAAGAPRTGASSCTSTCRSRASAPRGLPGPHRGPHPLPPRGRALPAGGGALPRPGAGGGGAGGRGRAGPARQARPGAGARPVPGRGPVGPGRRRPPLPRHAAAARRLARPPGGVRGHRAAHAAGRRA